MSVSDDRQSAGLSCEAVFAATKSSNHISYSSCRVFQLLEDWMATPDEHSAKLPALLEIAILVLGALARTPTSATPQMHCARQRSDVLAIGDKWTQMGVGVS
jgi:hypothetical protein